MATRLLPLNVVDFRGGINLRADAFQLRDNEVQLALNVEIDATSGFKSRRGWTRVNTTAPATWDPRNIHVQNFGGAETVMVANDDHILYLTATAFSVLQVAAVDVVVGAEGHLAAFAPWGDLVYVACGAGNSSVSWDGAGDATTLTQVGPTYQDDYVAGGTGNFPSAEHVCTHMGYAFTAYTEEDGTVHPNRVRWSHVNNPEAWAELDRVDVTQGGEHITGIVSFQDYLLIFKPNSVWMLTGYDPDTWAVTQLTQGIGATHSQVIAKGEQDVFFMSWPQGVYQIDQSSKVFEISPQLRPATKDGTVNGTAIENSWLSWANQKLYLGVPFSLTGTPTDAETLLIWDPSLQKGGSWVAHRGADGMGLGPVAQALISDRTLGCSRGTEVLVQLDATDSALDDLDGTPTAFPMYVTTRWFDAGWPTVKKSWRRPEYVVKERDTDYYIDFQVHIDFDESEARKTFRLNVLADGTTVVYDDGTLYDSGALYGAAAAGSRITRSSSLGLARAVRLTLAGEPGKSWGVDAIILKYLPRRFR